MTISSLDARANLQDAAVRQLAWEPVISAALADVLRQHRISLVGRERTGSRRATGERTVRRVPGFDDVMVTLEIDPARATTDRPHLR